MEADLAPVLEAHGEISPPMEVGDIILFRDDVIHRTHRREMTPASASSTGFSTQSEPWPEQVEHTRRQGVPVGLPEPSHLNTSPRDSARALDMDPDLVLWVVK